MNEKNGHVHRDVQVARGAQLLRQLRERLDGQVAVVGLARAYMRRCVACMGDDDDDDPRIRVRCGGASAER